jgi:hypothetical protein
VPCRAVPCRAVPLPRRAAPGDDRAVSRRGATIGR